MYRGRVNDPDVFFAKRWDIGMVIRKYEERDLLQMMTVWNEIVDDGIAFPEDTPLSEEGARSFFFGQSHTGVAEEDGMIRGLYILHPNNVGRCGHIANASYAVRSAERGRHIGEELVKDSLVQARKLGFSILQFNAVVKTNTHARHLYERLGFVQLGVIERGFRMKDGSYEDICPYYISLR